MSCPTPDLLLLLADGLLEAAQAEAVGAHARGCSACHAAQARLQTALAPLPAAAPRPFAEVWKQVEADHSQSFVKRVQEVPVPAVPVLVGSSGPVNAGVGSTISGYRITGKLGEGGMGVVYEGVHEVTGQKVAIKSLHPTLFGNQAARDRFVREGQALARLRHPNIIGLANMICAPNGMFLIMEYAEGEDLEQVLQARGLMPAERCLPWFVQVCDALHFAHGQQVIHRDIKPSNILVDPSGQAKVLDFGTAKLVDAQRLTQQGMTLGTVIYMSKEQLLGKPLDPRSDVYSLGVTLYECLTGQLPFYDEEERKLVVKIAKADPIPPSQHYPHISPRLEQVVLKAMAKSPDDRYQSAAELGAALKACLQGMDESSPLAALPTPVAAPSTSAPAPVTKPAAESWLPLALLVVALGAGVPLMSLGTGAARWAGLGAFVVFGVAALIAQLRSRPLN